MNEYKNELLANYKHYYKPESNHHFSLLVVKEPFGKTYNFYLDEIKGATFSYALCSIPFSQIDLYKEALRSLIELTDLKIEYRGFE